MTQSREGFLTYSYHCILFDMLDIGWLPLTLFSNAYSVWFLLIPLGVYFSSSEYHPTQSVIVIMKVTQCPLMLDPGFQTYRLPMSPTSSVSLEVADAKEGKQDAKQCKNSLICYFIARSENGWFGSMCPVWHIFHHN